MADVTGEGSSDVETTTAEAQAREAMVSGRVAALLAEINRVLGTTPETGPVAGLEAEIARFLRGFDDRLAVVNRRLDRVLERRA